MKKIKTCITNPEPYIYLPAKIKDASFKSHPTIPTVTVYVRKCAKRHNYWPVENVMVLSSQIAKVNEDGTIEDYKTIIFK